MELASNKIFRTVFANPLNYVQGNYNLYGEVRVEKVPNSGFFEKTLSCKLTPNAQDEATFELQDGIADYFPLPDFNPYLVTEISEITDNQARAQFWTAESYGDPAALQPLSLSETFTVLNAGVPKQTDTDYLNSYLPANRTFLTWHPGTKRVDPNQPELLHFYNYNPAITSLHLKVNLHFTDQEEEEITALSLTGAQFQKIYRMPAGYSQLQLGAVNGEKRVAKYVIWLEDQGGNRITKEMTYHLEQITKPYTTYWMFTNSLGMWEILRAEGKSSREMEIDREQSTGYLQRGYDRSQGETRTRVLGSTDTLELSTGFLSSKEEAQWATEILLSQKVVLLTQSNRIPYNLKTTSYRPYEDTDYKWFLRFSAELAYNNIKYGHL